MLVRLVFVLLLVPLMGGCAAVGVTILGAAHQLSGISYRTFTEPLPSVRRATLSALNRMEIKISAVEKVENGELIKATAADRNIEIELEALTPSTTRMRSVARKDGGIIVDSATAVEIIIQTEKALAPRA